MPAKPDLLRAFVALTPDPPWLPALSQIQLRLASNPAAQSVRWSKPAQIHLTLRFLGNISPAQSGDVIQQLRLVCREFHPFSLEPAGLGCFPTVRRPRVVWLGLGGGVSALCSLQKAITEALSSLGDPQEDKPFHPHLTLGRLSPGQRRPGDWEALLRGASLPHLDPWRVRSMFLMRSELKPEGARHSVLFAQPLSNAPRPGSASIKDLQSPRNAL